MQAVVSTSITIKEAPAVVFTYLSDPHYHYLWNPQLRDISPMTPLALGVRYKTESKVLGSTIEALNTVTSFTPPREMTLENPFGPVQYKADFRLTPKGDSTHLKLTITLSTDKKIWMFTTPVLKQLAHRELRTDLQALKIAVENRLG